MNCQVSRVDGCKLPSQRSKRTNSHLITDIRCETGVACELSLQVTIQGYSGDRVVRSEVTSGVG